MSQVKCRHVHAIMQKNLCRLAAEHGRNHGALYSKFSLKGVETPGSTSFKIGETLKKKTQVRTFQLCELGGLMSICTGAQQPRRSNETTKISPTPCLNASFTWTP